MKSKTNIKKKKIRIPLPKQTARVKESDKIYKRSSGKQIPKD
jgi:hypothetical protein